MDHESFNNVLKAYNDTTIETTPVKKKVGMEIRFKLTAKYSIIADEQLNETAYNIYNEIRSTTKIKSDKDGLEPVIRDFLSGIFSGYLKEKGAIDGREWLTWLEIDNFSLKESIWLTPRKLDEEINEFYSKEIGKLEVSVKGSISYKIPKLLRDR